MGRQRTVWGVISVAAIACGCANAPPTARTPVSTRPSEMSVNTPAPTTPYEPPPAVMAPSARADEFDDGEESNESLKPPPPARAPSNISPSRALPGAKAPPIALGGSSGQSWVFSAAGVISFGVLQLLTPSPSSE